MEKGNDCDQNFSPTPSISNARIITSMAAANDLMLRSMDIEQAFLLASKLLEGVNGRYSINLKDFWNVGLQAMCYSTRC